MAQIKFSPSVNIKRDEQRSVAYLPTPNAVQVAQQIGNDYKIGIRSFNIIGSFGTGKSSFLWAFQQSLNGNSYFEVSLPKTSVNYFFNIVADYRSIITVFANQLGIDAENCTSEAIFSELYNRYHDLKGEQRLMVIMIDEFGKFLEYAAEHDTEKELYFIQQLAEFVNDPEKDILLLTALHQNIEAYGLTFSNQKRNEWLKVKGRFKELPFNEPVEQLLYLAAMQIANEELDAQVAARLEQTFMLLRASKAFNFEIASINQILKKLFPLDPFAANVLTLLLQRYGQNERSLFSFLSSTDQTGLNAHRDQQADAFYHTARVYDYLSYNFYSFLYSQYNPDISAWRLLQSTLEKAERAFDQELNGYLDIIKTIGLLNLTVAAGTILDNDILKNYATICLGIPNAAQLIDYLIDKNLIFYRNYNKRYVLYEGSDLDIHSALIEAGSKIESVVDVTTLLNKYYQLPPIMAKEITYRKGTPRLFEYIISEYPVTKVPEGEIDGYINLVFNDKLEAADIQHYSAGQTEAVVYGFYKQSRSIKELLFEIEKTKRVIEENADDTVALEELNNIILHQQNLLNHKILNNFYSIKKEVVWVWDGIIQEQIRNKKDFNRLLSTIADAVYNEAPVFLNELVNRHRISPSIHTAKRAYFKALANSWGEPQLGFTGVKFPPERTIYMTLLEANGVQLFGVSADGNVNFNERFDFHFLWQRSLMFLETAVAARRSVSELRDLLKLKPFKLKQGLIDFWLPTFLFIKRNDFALFGNHGYIPNINDEVLELIAKNPEQYQVKAFNIDGIKLDLFNSYRSLLQQTQQERLTNRSFIETIKPFISFYTQLPEYAKKTKRLKKEALNIREAIVRSKDPEQTFFEDFPHALGIDINKLQSNPQGLQLYIDRLQEAIREIRTSYDELINRFELFLQLEIVGEELPFLEYQSALQKRYRSIKRHLLLPHQRKLVQRIDSQLDDRAAWLDTVAQVVTNVTLKQLDDEQELVLYDRFKFLIFELDSLTDISNAGFNEANENMVSIEISSFETGMNKKIVRLPKDKSEQVSATELRLRNILSQDPAIDIAALTNILKEMLKK